MASPKKKNGLMAEMEVSEALAKIIGTGPGETCSRPQVSFQTKNFQILSFLTPGDQEAVGLPEGQQLTGS